MKTMHTPGPWIAHNKNNPDYMDIESKNGKRISSVLIIDDEEEDEQEDLANAKLIAAAPDLLEAVQNLLYLGERLEIESGEDDPAVEQAREAIKKAIE